MLVESAIDPRKIEARQQQHREDRREEQQQPAAALPTIDSDNGLSKTPFTIENTAVVMSRPSARQNPAEDLPREPSRGNVSRDGLSLRPI